MKKLFILASVLVLAGGVFAGPRTAKPVSIIHARVMRDFVLRYDDVSYAQWMSDGKGSTMYFIKDGFRSRAVYDAKGRWLYSLVSYGEAGMPHDIRTVVKRENFDLAITGVQEVQTEAGKAWIVHLEDNANLKIVKVTMDREMETMDEFRKL